MKTFRKIQSKTKCHFWDIGEHQSRSKMGILHKQIVRQIKWWMNKSGTEVKRWVKTYSVNTCDSTNVITGPLKSNASSNFANFQWIPFLCGVGSNSLHHIDRKYNINPFIYTRGLLLQPLLCYWLCYGLLPTSSRLLTYSSLNLTVKTQSQRLYAHVARMGWEQENSKKYCSDLPLFQLSPGPVHASFFW